VNGKAHGKIITFYSYKGGTGRSLALANVAWILASRGKRVLMMDWDLEAPGLHRYFHPFLEDKNLTSSRGIIDLVMKFEDAAIRPSALRSEEAKQNDASWYVPLADISEYVIPLAWSFENGGGLDLLPAGQQGSAYAARVNSLNWPSFYNRLGGGVFLEAVKKDMRQKYDYVLIDSRTGVSDTAGICTVQMPDILIVCFTLNIQSIEGATAVAASVTEQRRLVAGKPRPDAQLCVFPVPMRVELAEKERLEQARELAARTFAPFLGHLSEDKREKYLGRVEVPYVPFYAYSEVLATIADATGVPSSVLASLERLTSFVTDGEISTQVPLPQQERERLKTLYLSGVRIDTVRNVLQSQPELHFLCEDILARQHSWLENKRQERYLLDSQLLVKLQEQTRLLVALLNEEKSFHEFWSLSKKRVRRREVVNAVLPAVGVIGGVGSLVALLPYFRVNLSSHFATYPYFFLAGVSGALVASIVSFQSNTAEQRFKSTRTWTMLLVELINGGLAGFLVSIVLKGSVLEKQISSPFIVLAFGFLAGYSARSVLRGLIRLPIESSDKQK
jgi:MinD-like ATPase involved in chromosome partitioning or flagellar assembly